MTAEVANPGEHTPGTRSAVDDRRRPDAESKRPCSGRSIANSTDPADFAGRYLEECPRAGSFDAWPRTVWGGAPGS